ncbi:MAG: extracellular solute-binding protein [Clostridia bacterium]|nr:extracellular solute-binding protein [Clostridia bacterium]
MRKEGSPEPTELVELPTDDPSTLIEGSIVLGVPEAYGQTDRDALAQYVQMFCGLFPNVNVETRIVSSAGAALKAEAGTPEYADVVFFPGEETFEYAYVDHTLLPLNTLVDAAGGADDIHSGVYESCTVNNVLYALGTNCDPFMLIYNQSVVEAEARNFTDKIYNGLTFSEFREVCRYLTSSHQIGAQLEFNSEPLILSLLQVSSESSIKSWANVEKCKVSFGRNAAVQELYDLVDCYIEGCILPSADVFDNINPYSIFDNPVSTAFERGTPVVFRAALLSELGAIAAEFDKNGHEWNVAPFPLTSLNGVNSGTAVATDCFGIRANTSDPAAASAFVLFAWTEAGQSVLNSARGTLPALLTLSVELFLDNVRVVNTSGKNFAACIPAKDRSVPAYFSCYVPPEAAEYMRSAFPLMPGKAILGLMPMADSLSKLETMATQNYWVSIYYDYTGK